jgi:hypothetical protein
MLFRCFPQYPANKCYFPIDYSPVTPVNPRARFKLLMSLFSTLHAAKHSSRGCLQWASCSLVLSTDVSFAVAVAAGKVSDPRIVGGHDVSIEEVPYQVRLHAAQQTRKALSSKRPARNWENFVGSHPAKVVAYQQDFVMMKWTFLPTTLASKTLETQPVICCLYLAVKVKLSLY